MIRNIIIGGGIAGLNVGFQLWENGEEFLILESSEYLGGKVYTQNYKNNILELGASIFHSRQRGIMNLINKFGLSNDLKVLKDSENIFAYNNCLIDSDCVQSRLTWIWDYLSQQQKEEMSIQKLAKQLLNKDDYKFLVEYTKDWYEIKDQNNIILFQSLKNTGKIFKLKSGLSTLIKKMGLLLKDNILLKHPVNLIYKNKKGEFEIDRKWKCKKLYLCTNLSGAKKIKFIDFDILPVLRLIRPVASLRFYVIFKKRGMIPGTIISNKSYKWCIPTGPYSAMITYTDGALATKFYNLGEKASLKLILEDLSQLLYKKISVKDVEKTFFSYWREAFYIIKPELTRKEYNETINSLPKNFKQTVVPLDFGLNQAWMEGSLIKI
jgi:hypothetical protein